MSNSDLYFNVKTSRNEIKFTTIVILISFIFLIGYSLVEEYFLKTNNTPLALFVWIWFVFFLVYNIFSKNKNWHFNIENKIVLELINNPQNDAKLTKTVQSLYELNKKIILLDIQILARSIESSMNKLYDTKIIGKDQSEENEIETMEKTLTQLKDIISKIDGNSQIKD